MISLLVQGRQGHPLEDKRALRARGDGTLQGMVR
jgi:hypothetical protein